MEISLVEIRDLFGYYNYSISLHNKITIIHGPNGCGKTTVLKLINAFFNKDLAYLRKVDFSSIKFLFSDERHFLIVNKKKHVLKGERRTRPHDEDYNYNYLSYEYVNEDEKSNYDPFENNDINTALLKKILRRPRVLPFLERISTDKWLDRRIDRTLTTDEVLDEYGNMILTRYGDIDEFDPIPNNILEVIDEIDVRMISTDRLTETKVNEDRYNLHNEVKIEQKVTSIAKNLAARIKETLQQYGLVSQSNDRSFPIRLIRAKEFLEIDQIKDKLVELERKRKKFEESGILDEEQDINMNELVSSINEANRQTLSLYATDTEQKLDVLSKLSELITLFGSLIDKNFINKKITFNKNTGFLFSPTYSNGVINPGNLSSGEQHEIVMFYDLVFNTNTNTLILIDEPEISLHVKWQLEYINDLFEIIEKTGFKVIIATHSPQIINDKWNLTVSLGEDK